MAGEAGSRTPGLGRITGKAPGPIPATPEWSQAHRPAESHIRPPRLWQDVYNLYGDFRELLRNT